MAIGRNFAAVAAAAALGLSACASVPGGAARVESPQRIEPIDLESIRGTSSDTALSIQGVSAAETAAIAAALDLPPQVGSGGFRPAAPGEGGSRLAIGFAGAGPNELCAGGDGGGGARGSRATLAWCSDADMLASAEVESPALAGNDPAAFAGAVEQGLEVMLTPDPADEPVS